MCIFEFVSICKLRADESKSRCPGHFPVVPVMQMMSSLLYMYIHTYIWTYI